MVCPLIGVVYGGVLGETLRHTGRLMGTSIHFAFAIFVFTIIKTPNFIKQALLTAHSRLILARCTIGGTLGFQRACIRVVPLLMAAETNNLHICKAILGVLRLNSPKFFRRYGILLAVG